MHSNNRYKTVSKLIVRNLNKTKDIGRYECFVQNKYDSKKHLSKILNVIDILGKYFKYENIRNNLTFKSNTMIYYALFLISIGANGSFIDIISGGVHLPMNPNRKEATFSAKYTGIPIPTIFWRDINGNPIPWSKTENKTRKYEALKFDKKLKTSTTLRIRAPKTSDSGFYTLCANNGQIQKEQKFELLVKGVSHQ